MKFTLLLALAILPLNLVTATPVAVMAIHKDLDGLTLKMQPGMMRLRVFSPRVVEVVYAPDSLPHPDSLSVIESPEHVPWDFNVTDDEIVLTTGQLIVHLDRATGALQFDDKSGQTLLAEDPFGGKSMTPVHLGKIDTWRSEQVFQLPRGEAIYGLGQHPDSPLNYRGTKVHLQQENRDVAVPVLMSNRGYGLLWDNPAITDVDVGSTNKFQLTWRSEAAKAIDYYFMYGPEIDEVIADYRNLTGIVPMFPKWAWGFWQCRERYQTQAQLLGVVAEYRQRHLPLDGIIQDWQYWPSNGWGSHDFDPWRYPDPTAMVKAVHAAHAHIIISVWARFDLGTANLARLEKAGAVYPPVYENVYPQGQGKWYDPFNPKGRLLYWKFLSEKLFKRGFDGWWMDASEPELGGHWGEMRDLSTAAGPGALVFNAFPLEHSGGVYDGQREESSKKRVFILTRSAWAGQQRNAAVTWSGDTTGHWDVFQKQIPTGLNFVLTGIPYWNTDIGGFFGGDPLDPKYAELFTRWFQFGAFCPMFRVHGTGQPKEIWRFDEPTQKILAQYDVLRYRFLPYIYSDAWQVTDQAGTMMRPLIMDFRADTNVYNLPDQFMFGPALMACPVTHPGDFHRRVYLPETSAPWYDFWTGNSVAGGQFMAADSPIETMPLYVRAGSIIPLGPKIEYTAQATDPIELRVYRGANASFTLYEDEGDNYNYEEGVYSLIPISWNENAQTLTIGERQGRFRGMTRQHIFQIVWVSPGHGAGIPVEDKPDATIQYNGRQVTVRCGK